jgi:predicted aspartyl protease
MTTRRQQGDDAMGRVAAEILASNNEDLILAQAGHLPPERVRRFQLQGTVDTAAALLVLPADVADRLGLPKAGDAVVRYADRRSATRTTVDQVRVELLGRQGTFRAIVEPDRTTALIGAIVLEDLDLLVDCKNNRLYPRDPDHITAELE